MTISDKKPRKWWVIFTESRYRGGIMRLLKRDYSHVYAVTKSLGGQYWIIVNSLVSHLEPDIRSIRHNPRLRDIVGARAKILTVWVNPGDKPRWTFCIFNCVEVTKACLGVRSFWTWTPWQLFKLLERGNCG
jgi:hypothetical protein